MGQNASRVPDWVLWLPHCNATLNAVALVLLLWGYQLVRSGRLGAHRRAMLACFATSVAFLLSYLTYHAYVDVGRPFPTYPPAVVKYFYWGMLASHIVLAALVPFLAVGAIFLGLKDRRAAHRRLVRWAFPIWVYVSVTGILVYLMIYQIYPPLEG
jgi:uncharacterized membrane protein YozB (DUF420 family)